MIILRSPTPLLEIAVRRAARPDEDVVGPELADRAISRGFPRLVVEVEEERGTPTGRGPVQTGRFPRLVVGATTLDEWETERCTEPVPRRRVDFITARVTLLLRDHAIPVTWVDHTLGELGRTAGIRVPATFRGMARRVMELPCHYTDLGPLVDLTGVGRDALRARFRRRGLPSPSVWLRWFRVMAAAHLLSDRNLSVRAVSHRLGFDNDGNFCRMVRTVAGVTPTELREPAGRGWVLTSIAAELRRPGCPEAWDSLGDLFLRAA